MVGSILCLSLILAVPESDGLAFGHGAQNRVLEQVVRARIDEGESDSVAAVFNRIERLQEHRRPGAMMGFINADPELAVLWREMIDQYPQTGLAETEKQGVMADH